MVQARRRFCAALAGLLPSSGRATYDGADLSRMPPKQRARLIAYLPQGHQAHWPLPARDIVALGRHPHGSGDPTRLPAAEQAIVDAAMARTDVAALAEQNVQTLSGGERARVMIARMLAVQAPVLLADEPTAALDPRHQLEIMRVLKTEAARGCLSIAVTHDLMLAARFADRVLLMADGTLAADGTAAEVLTRERLRSVYHVDTRQVMIDGSPMEIPWSAA